MNIEQVADYLLSEGRRINDTVTHAQVDYCTRNHWKAYIWTTGGIGSSAYGHKTPSDAVAECLADLEPTPDLAAILGISEAA